ncbi:MaoC/PaaZ C-terminal domain-containing protein [Thermoactinospora rubra]|uniref:MaoC/PaaZ C-terminal domain-containing protein n=1 Tax=Thermoactinospora rubra TaxID=1088767 RepID=UPI000A100518|nr:MaoC/PaaZ C-terminal domain-containing protein [Thermoactinospora rubra]
MLNEGTVLPELSIDLTPTLVVATALATRDFTPVHHDVSGARAQGAKDVFLNILTTMGLIERYVTDHVGRQAVIKRLSVRLGVPAYAGDRLTFTGTVVSREDSQDGSQYTVEVRGKVSIGDHATATVTFAIPGEA